MPIYPSYGLRRSSCTLNRVLHEERLRPTTSYTDVPQLVSEQAKGAAREPFLRNMDICFGGRTTYQRDARDYERGQRASPHREREYVRPLRNMVSEYGLLLLMRLYGFFTQLDLGLG